MPVTVNDLVGFLQAVTYSFQDVLFLSFVLMITFAVLFNIKRIFIDGLL